MHEILCFSTNCHNVVSFSQTLGSCTTLNTSSVFESRKFFDRFFCWDLIQIKSINLNVIADWITKYVPTLDACHSCFFKCFGMSRCLSFMFLQVCRHVFTSRQQNTFTFSVLVLCLNCVCVYEWKKSFIDFIKKFENFSINFNSFVIIKRWFKLH